MVRDLSISESPTTAGVHLGGTSDGKVHVTRDGGGSWTRPHREDHGAGVAKTRTSAACARPITSAGRAFVSKSGYRFDDFKPYLAMTDDFGATWKSIAGNLPNEPINVIWEDTKNPDLLFVGNDGGAFVSIDRGAHWVKMNNNMPNISVKDLAVHPRDQDLVLGSYARGIWITNIAPLQELNANVLAEDAHLFSILPTTQRITWSFGANDYLFGQRHIQTPNDPDGMAIYYYLKSAAAAACHRRDHRRRGERSRPSHGPNIGGNQPSRVEHARRRRGRRSVVERAARVRRRLAGAVARGGGARRRGACGGAGEGAGGPAVERTRTRSISGCRSANTRSRLRSEARRSRRRLGSSKRSAGRSMDRSLR